MHCEWVWRLLGKPGLWKTRGNGSGWGFVPLREGILDEGVYDY